MDDDIVDMVPEVSENDDVVDMASEVSNNSEVNMIFRMD